jgi:hypothetical protein
MKTRKNVEAEVRRLNDRVAGSEAIERILFKVQMQSLAKAEQLRKLALAVVNAKPGTAKARGALYRLRWFVEDVGEFHKHPLAGLRRTKGKIPWSTKTKSR